MRYPSGRALLLRELSERRRQIHACSDDRPDYARRSGATYGRAMSHGKKIHVPWLTSVMKVSTIGRPCGLE
jgi:hypothetical protein